MPSRKTIEKKAKYGGDGFKTRLEGYEHTEELVRQLRREKKAIRALNEELRAAEEELRAQTEKLIGSKVELERVRQQYQGLFHEAPDGYIVTDSDGFIQDVNQAAADILGQKVEDLRRFHTHRLSDFLPKSVINSALKPLLEAKAESISSHRWEGQIFTLKGLPFWAAISVSVFRNSAGEIMSLQWLIRDIGEQKKAERALRETEDRFHTMANAIPQLAWIAKPDGYIYWYNQRWYEYTGTTPQQMEGWGWQSVHDPRELPKVLQRWRSSIATGEPFDMTFPLRGADGAFRPFLTRVMPLKDEQGRVQHWFGTNTDVTEQMHAENVLRESEAKYRSLFQHMLEGFAHCRMLYDDQGRPSDFVYLAVNDAFGRLTGLENVIGRRVTEVVPRIKELNPEVFEIYGRVASTGNPEKFEIDFKPLNLYFSVSVHSIDKGYFVAVFHDITERKRAEKTLAESEKKFWLLSQTAEKLLRSRDPQSVVNDLCREVMKFLDCQAFFNYLVDEVTGGLHLNACAGIPEEQARQIEWLDYGVAVCGCVAQSGERMIAENIHLSSDIKTDLVRSYGIQAYCCHPLKTHDRLIGTLSFGTRTRARFNESEIEVMRTVADQVSVAMQRIQAERSLRELNATLEKRVEERTADLSHRAAQLRALAGELTRAEQRERRRLAKVLHDHLQQLLVGAKFRLAVLARGADDLTKQASKEIEELLDESISSSRSLTAELSPPILHEAGLKAGLEWLARRMADRHGLLVDLELEDIEGLPEDLKVMLFESARELLFNVTKHARTRTSAVSLRQADGFLQLTVSDPGIGFDPDILLSTGQSGGGFGLFSVRERLELFGGRLEIQSSPGNGSRIFLYLPVTQAETQPAVCEPAVSPDAGPKPAQDLVPSRKLRIMLADDHAVVRQGIANLLNDEPDLEVVGMASDGREAVELTSKLLPDIILMDVSMPRLNGVEATRIIRNEFSEIRIIGLSMFEDVERAQAMRDAGAVDYLTKSGPAEELIKAIRTSALVLPNPGFR